MGVVWIFLLVAGLWALFTGKLPMVLFSGLGTHRIDGTAARIIGACLALSALLSSLSMVLLDIFYGSTNLGYALVCGLIPIFLFIAGTTLAARRVREPVQRIDDSGNPLSPEGIKLDKLVRQKTQRSMFLVALGLGVAIIAFPPFGVVLFALAYFQARGAISPMEAAHIGGRYKNDLNFIRLLSVVLAVGLFLISRIVPAP